MKKAVIIFLFFLCAIVTFAQSEAETVKPTFGVELDREVAAARIENEDYQNLVVELKAADFGDIFTLGVRVIVRDAKTGKRIYKKRFSKSYLYAFSDGSLVVGKGNALTQLVLYKANIYGEYRMRIREKGIY